ncbi:dynamin family protein [Olsenella uli]|uniref:dynamin family protein n=1 Tax=Olsenella uli TaxID=133926 RepID=UPI0019565E92|nr:dynamin family protein [Olsenella uli]
MSKVKVVSDPYHRSVQFMSWSGAWAPLDYGSNPNSALLSKQFVQGFLPFKAHQIVESIVSEYGSLDEPTEIVFEGPDDEWAELIGVCAKSPLRERVRLVRGNRFLANARDILPFVRTEFESVSSIISGSLEGDADAEGLLKMFKDASGDVVPVCVVGNYSSGKSTFINALIGAELLPSGDKPLTARVYQIERSDQPDRASVSIDYMNGELAVSLSDGGMTLSGPDQNGALAQKIVAAVSPEDASPIVDRARKVLTAINEHRAEDAELIGNLVKVKVPYKRGAWMDEKRFVIFDTPGSNSNSNIDHLRVLQEAMRGMSDGLPIYVTEYSAIDSNDNAELYDEIKKIEALDERFSMIVVNKADAADLSEGGLTPDDVDYVMGTAVARNMYAQGIYFVSSVMGLGAKTGGHLSDRHYDRCYRQLLASYQDPEDRYYTRLYDYDLMPTQLRTEMLADAEGCADTVLANSGLYSVECGIEDFATKYSVYNKCYRSDVLLRKLIEKTDDVLEDASTRLQESKRLGEDDLDESRAAHLDRLNATSDALRERSTAGYLPFMNERDFTAGAMLDTDLLRKWEGEYSKVRQQEEGVDEKDRAADETRHAVSRKFRERFSNLVDSRDFLGLGNLATSLVGDISKAVESHSEEMDARHAADRSASEDLLGHVRKHFDIELSRAISTVEARSKHYWELCAQEAKDSLLELVSNGEGVDETQREALRSIILSFRPLSLAGSVPEIKDIRLPFDPNKLWKAPLALQHNLELSRRVSRWRSVVEPAHEESFLGWLEELTDELGENIVGLNPELRSKLEFIRKNEREIAELRLKRDRLQRAEERVSSLMSWRGED